MNEILVALSKAGLPLNLAVLIGKKFLFSWTDRTRENSIYGTILGVEFSANENDPKSDPDLKIYISVPLLSGVSKIRFLSFFAGVWSAFTEPAYEDVADQDEGEYEGYFTIID